MKGVLFNVAEDVADATLPENSWDDALGSACLSGAYTSLGNYPDEELTELVHAIAAQTGLSTSEVLRHVGCHGYGPLVARRPELVEGIDDVGTLLHHLELVIHPEVHKLDPLARPPSFEVVDEGPDAWTLHYRSHRQLCHLAEGLVEGAAESFGSRVVIDQPMCALDGAEHCVLRIRVV